MEMHEIKYCLAARRTLNFHRAAELSHVSQPARTRAIQKLEGSSPLDRTTLKSAVVCLHI
jgi:DNA-binding transcriptional LysR family regulator